MNKFIKGHVSVVWYLRAKCEFIVFQLRTCVRERVSMKGTQSQRHLGGFPLFPSCLCVPTLANKLYCVSPQRMHTKYGHLEHEN